MQLKERLNRGDTLVEVLLSTVVLSIVLAGAYSLTTRATLMNQVSFERTEVSALVQQQAELIRSVRNQSSVDDAWQTQILGPRTTTAPIAQECRNEQTFFDNFGSFTDNAFYLANDGSVVDGYKDVHGLYYIWVEAYAPSGQGYVDFHISGCWENYDETENLYSGIVMRLQRDN